MADYIVILTMLLDGIYDISFCNRLLTHLRRVGLPLLFFLLKNTIQQGISIFQNGMFFEIQVNHINSFSFFSKKNARVLSSHIHSHTIPFLAPCEICFPLESVTQLQITTAATISCPRWGHSHCHFYHP